MGLSRWEELELLQNSDELVLGDIADLCDIKVLELWLQVKSFGGDDVSKALDKFCKSGFFLRREAQS